MRRSPTRLALVRQAVLDVRRRPDHRSELLNQLLLGEAVRVDPRPPRRGWVLVAGLEDGYPGWVRDWGLHPVTAHALAAWRRLARHRIAVPLAMPLADAGALDAPGPLPWMARVVVVGRHGVWLRIRLPDGRHGRLRPREVLLPGRQPRALIARARELSGAPYLWGGRTMLGIDCSGFTQLLFAERNVALPRDAHEQWRAVRRLADGEPLRAGDLAFFSSKPRGRVEHVGVMVGRGVFLHARRVVQLNSLDPSNTLFDKALAGQLRGFGRPGRKRR